MAANKPIFDSALQKAQEYAINNQWSEALPEYMRAAREFPNDLATRSSVAHALLKLGLFDKALVQYEGLARVNPHDPLLLTRIVEIYHRTNQTPQTIESLLRLKRLHLKQNHIQEAIEVLTDAADLAPDQPQLAQELLDLAQSADDHQTAANAAMLLANYYQPTQPDKAIEMAERAISLNPNHADAPKLLASLKPNSRTYTDYLTELPPLEDVTEPSLLEPNSATSTLDHLIAKAEAALEQGETDAAIQQYEQVLRLGVDRADIYYSLGNLYVQQGQPSRAVEYLERAARDKDYAPSAYYTLGQVYEGAGQLDTATQAYERALSLIDLENVNVNEAGELIDMYEVVAECYIKQQQESKAAALYNQLSIALQTKNIRTGKAAIVAAKAREMSERLEQAKIVVATPASKGPANDTAKLTTRNETAQSQSKPDSEKLLFADETTASTQSEFKAQGNGHNISANGVVLTGLLSKKGGKITIVAPPSPVVAVAAAPVSPLVFPTNLLKIEPHEAASPYLRAAEDFIRRDLELAATDACHEIIRLYPDYLPAQVILGEIYVGQNKLEQARVKYQYIVNLYQMRNEPLKAIEVYKRLVEVSPDNQGMHTRLADMMLQHGQKEAAAEVLLGTIQNLVKIGQTEQALEDCKKLRNLAPQSLPVRLEYGALLNRVGDYNTAIGEFRRALELEPTNLRALVWLNITLFLNSEGEVKWNSFKSVLDRTRENDRGRASISGEYLQALNLYDHAGLNYALGCLQLEAHENNVATRSFEQSAQIASVKAEQAEYELLARFQLGQLYLQAKRHDEAIQEFSKVLSLLEKADLTRYADSALTYGALPTQVAIYRYLAQAFIAGGKIEYAVKSLKRVKRLLPFDREVHFQLAELDFQRGQLNEALGELGELADHYEAANQPDDTIAVMQEMVRLAPNNIPVRDKLSNIYMKRGLTEAGLQELDELSELQRKNGRLRDAVKTLQRAAETYWLMMRQDKAYELYDRIVRISPGDVEARQQLVNLHIMAGRMADAVEEQRTIAQICLQTKGPKEAIGALHQVISLAPEDTRAYFALAQVLSDTGEYAQAYKLYGRVLKIAPDNSKAINLQAQIKAKAVGVGQL